MIFGYVLATFGFFGLNLGLVGALPIDGQAVASATEGGAWVDALSSISGTGKEYIAGTLSCDPCTPQNPEAVTTVPIVFPSSTFAVALGGVNLQGFMPSPTGQGSPIPTVADQLNIEITPVERQSDSSGFTFVLPAAPRPTQGSNPAQDAPGILNDSPAYVPDVKVLGGPPVEDETLKAPSISIILPKPSNELQNGVTHEVDQNTRISPGKTPGADSPNSAPISSSAGSQTSTKYWLYYVLISQVGVAAALL